MSASHVCTAVYVFEVRMHDATHARMCDYVARFLMSRRCVVVVVSDVSSARAASARRVRLHIVVCVRAWGVCVTNTRCDVDVMQCTLLPQTHTQYVAYRSWRAVCSNFEVVGFMRVCAAAPGMNTE